MSSSGDTQSSRLRYIVLGMGKSGTTALYTAIADGVHEPVDRFFEPPDVSVVRPSGPDHAVVAKVLLEKMSLEATDQLIAEFDKRLFLVRDPRDVLVSRLLYKIRDMKLDEQRLSDFIGALRAKEADPTSVGVVELYEMLSGLAGEPGYLEAFPRVHRSAVRKWLRLRHAYRLVRYESYIDGDTTELSDYVGFEVSPQVEVDPRWRRVTRSKGYGDWKHWFLPKDLDFVRENASEFMAAFGYDGDWETASRRVIPPETTSGYVERIIEMRRSGTG